MLNRKVKVAVLAGGISSERDISLQSGLCVAKALRSSGYDVIITDILPEDLRILDDKSVDVFFICLHGQFGEDGQLQKILEDKNLCYTHSDSDASKAAMDKITAKTYFEKAGVKTPTSIRFVDSISVGQVQQQLECSCGRYIVKPVSHGSSVGVDIVSSAEEAIIQCCINKTISSDYMIEQFIPGREITVGILNGRALPILEIRPKVGFYDYHAKYIYDDTEYLFDTITDRALIERISADALKCFDCLGCRHVARVDFILADDGTAYALEINTIPGMTAHSCVPKAAAKIGVSMSELCVRIVRQAMADHKQKDVPLLEVMTDDTKAKENKVVRQSV
jgi:D-alanine-D-alanine ligase